MTTFQHDPPNILPGCLCAFVVVVVSNIDQKIRPGRAQPDEANQIGGRDRTAGRINNLLAFAGVCVCVCTLAKQGTNTHEHTHKSDTMNPRTSHSNGQLGGGLY